MKYILDKKYIRKIIDFKSDIIFQDINVYTCIMIFDNKPKDFLIYNNKEVLYENIYKTYNIFDIFDNTKQSIANEIKTFNGIATLRDNIFIHTTKLYEEPCWKPIFKVSKNTYKYIIFPYNNGKIIEENIFKKNNPETYEYLIQNKEELNARDKGNKTYEAWYAFGRKQGITEFDGDVLFIPTMGTLNFPIYKKKWKLFYSGICIMPSQNSKLSIEEINVIINEKKNREYLFDLSSKRGSDWINISSTNIKKLLYLR